MTSNSEYMKIEQLVIKSWNIEQQMIVYQILTPIPSVGVRQDFLSTTLSNIFLEDIIIDTHEKHQGTVIIEGRSITNFRCSWSGWQRKRIWQSSEETAQNTPQEFHGDPCEKKYQKKKK